MLNLFKGLRTLNQILTETLSCGKYNTVSPVLMYLFSSEHEM